ncbi:MAG: 30S ribosome-binding factor RbfA [Gemmatimonadales bacterium]|nr:MAG: 30S ribosome-binding factor RbfA [Gemmatimonadales bacterium]
MAGKRKARLDELFKREITRILRSDVRDPRVGVPTITGADVTTDLWSAKIFVRPGPTREDPSGLIEGLVAATPYIRRELGKSLTLRRIPELRFQLDRSMEHAARIESLLREVLPPEARGVGEESNADADPEEGDKE